MSQLNVYTLCIFVLVVSSHALRLKGNTARSMEIHLDTTCGDCHRWILDEFEPLWRDKKFQEAMTKSYNISFWAHTITRHSQTFSLNLALDCASKHFSFEDFVDTLLKWEAQIEPWAAVSPSPMSSDAGGSGPLDTTIQEVHVDEDSLLKKSVPERAGFEGVALVKTCMAKEANETAEWVRQHTPQDFHEVPLVVIDGVRQVDAVDGLKSFLCSQMQGEALESCPSDSHSLIQSKSSYCKGSRTHEAVEGQMLLQKTCAISQGLVSMPESESEDTMLP